MPLKPCGKAEECGGSRALPRLPRLILLLNCRHTHIFGQICSYLASSFTRQCWRITVWIGHLCRERLFVQLFCSYWPAVATLLKGGTNQKTAKNAGMNAVDSRVSSLAFRLQNGLHRRSYACARGTPTQLKESSWPPKHLPSRRRRSASQD